MTEKIRYSMPSWHKTLFRITYPWEENPSAIGAYYAIYWTTSVEINTSFPGIGVKKTDMI